MLDAPNQPEQEELVREVETPRADASGDRLLREDPEVPAGPLVGQVSDRGEAPAERPEQETVSDDEADPGPERRLRAPPFESTRSLHAEILRPVTA